MRHRKHTFKLGRTGAHRRAMLANMASSLITHNEIKTTVHKAKELRRFAEKMVTYGKKGDLHHRRLAIAKLRDVEAVQILFDEVAPRYLERPGGYTRIVRLGARRFGDAAEMCLLQFVEQDLPAKKSKKKKASKSAGETGSDKNEVKDSAAEKVEDGGSTKAEEKADVEEKAETESASDETSKEAAKTGEG